MLRKGLGLPLLLLVALPWPHAVFGQADTLAKAANGVTVYGGYSYLFNSFNNHSTGTIANGLNGWDADVSLPVFHRWDLKVEGLGFYDSTFSPTRAHFILAGPEVKHRFVRDSVFVQGLIGLGHINSAAMALGGEPAGRTNTFAADMGGGIDFPFLPRVAWRVEGGALFSAFSSQSDQIHGLPRMFGRVSTGVVLRF